MISGACGLKPDEFWSLTPAEITAHVKGTGLLRDGNKSMAAWVVSRLISSLGMFKRRISASRLFKDFMRELGVKESLSPELKLSGALKSVLEESRSRVARQQSGSA